MVINGKPSLACDVRISALTKCKEIRIEPLRKFPIVADLIVDRSILFENLKALKLWFEQSTGTEGQIDSTGSVKDVYCYGCLEVCPNFYVGGEFFGMSAFVPISRILTNLPESQKKELCQEFTKNICMRVVGNRLLVGISVLLESTLKNYLSIRMQLQSGKGFSENEGNQRALLDGIIFPWCCQLSV